MTAGITEIAASISALAASSAAILGYINSRKIKEVHVSLDGRLSQLLKATHYASRADGVVQGREDQKRESKEEQRK